MSEIFTNSPEGEGGSPPTTEDVLAALSGARVLLADRDVEGAASAAARALLAQGAAWVHTVGSPQDFVEAGQRPPDSGADWDVAVWDTGLSGSDDALTAFLLQWHTRHPHVPVVVTEETPNTRRGGAVLRGRAADMVERHDRDGLVAAVARALHERPDPAEAAEPRSRVHMLVVGAHPDDVEIGAGGTIHRRADEGWDVTILTLSRGAGGGDPDERREEALRAATAMGARLVMEDLPDGSIADDSHTVRTIERTVADTRPDVVLVHSDSDTHQDHRAVHRATLVASRRVPRVACYQSPSATVAYRPNRFVGLREGDLDAKLSAINEHHSQAASRWYLEEDLLRSTARYWGRFSQARYAEPLEVIRDATPLGFFPADHV
ncbi:PIG-L deacetylase family protein [Streptomyces sp. NPDC059897]|uniref:PIG-L deacetylase family protein n=1 Tax=Streptomyces sp. NPDC059897 TaxID=3346994 RepID=UPI0036695AD9